MPATEQNRCEVLHLEGGLNAWFDAGLPGGAVYKGPRNKRVVYVGDGNNIVTSSEWRRGSERVDHEHVARRR